MVVYKKDITDTRVANDTYLNAYKPQVIAWYDVDNKEVLELTVDAYWSLKTQIIDENGSSINQSNPLFVTDVDVSDRISLNTVFWEKISGTRIPSLWVQFQYWIETWTYTDSSANWWSIATSNSLLTVATWTNNNWLWLYQTNDYLRYIPWHEGYCLFTAVFTTAVANSYQRVWLYDDSNWFFLGYEWTTFKVTRRRAWSDDTKTITLNNVFTWYDPTKWNVYRITFGYLWFAAIHFEVMRPNWSWARIEEFQYPNTATVTHIAQTNLPFRMAVANTWNTTNITLSDWSYSIWIVDWGWSWIDTAARKFAFWSWAKAITAWTTHIVTFRNKATFNSIANRIPWQLLLLNATTDLNKIASFRLEKWVTITWTPTWTDVNTSDSVFEYSTNAVITAGTWKILLAWWMWKTDTVFQNLTDQIIQLRPWEYASFYVITTGTWDISLALRWKELF